MTPHKHHDLIVAWAKGAIIQSKTPKGTWFDVAYNTPLWAKDVEYRIKPEPKPDRIAKYQVEWTENTYSPRWHQKMLFNLKLTFDGETGVLKKAEVINEA